MDTASVCVVAKTDLRRSRIQGSSDSWSASLGNHPPTWQACQTPNWKHILLFYGTGVPVKRVRDSSPLMRLIVAVGRSEM